MKKIDVHCHSTPRKVKNVLVDSASIETIEKCMKEHEIEKTVVLASYFPHNQSGISNFRLYNWIRDKPQFLLCGSFDFPTYFYQGLNELEELADMGALKAIKTYTTYQQIDIHSEKMRAITNLADRYSLPMIFHCGDSYGCRRKHDKPAYANDIRPSDLSSLIEQFSRVPFLIAHMGNNTGIEATLEQTLAGVNDIIEMTKRFPNVYTDNSGLIDSFHDQKEMPAAIDKIKHYLHECGHERFLFGTDFPVQTYEDSFHMIEEALKGFSEKVKEDIYYNNAARIFK